MPNTQNAPLEEPGKRSGEGSKSILPHLTRQTQTQIKVPVKPPEAKDSGLPEDSQPPG
jgi:hypothetical protein